MLICNQWVHAWISRYFFMSVTQIWADQIKRDEHFQSPNMLSSKVDIIVDSEHFLYFQTLFKK